MVIEHSQKNRADIAALRTDRFARIERRLDPAIV
jgi:hypothetical protein